MSAIKAKQGETIDLSKHRNQKDKDKGKGKPQVSARNSPELKDVPGASVRGRDGKNVTLINLPSTDAGAEMVLHLIRAHPEAHLMTGEGGIIAVRDIVMIVTPERDQAEVENARRQAASESPPLRSLMVNLSLRLDDRVGIFNIPDSPEGAALFHSILRRYSHDREGQPSGYTLYTTDYGYIPVHELAKSNKTGGREP